VLEGNVRPANKKDIQQKAMNTKRWRVAGIDFAHMHMAELLDMVAAHPSAEIVGICDRSRERMTPSIDRLGLSERHVFIDYAACLETTRPDLVILCPATAEHGQWVERVAPYGAHLVVEKPFAANLMEADRMITAAQKSNVRLIINWPIRWHASHSSAKRLLEDGAIGELLEVHHYDGNRGPLLHSSKRTEVDLKEKRESWFYDKGKGGGSLMDYLGYGVTFATWFMNGREPLEITTVVDGPQGLEVDEHSVTIARYASGLSTFETRWGTMSDPWILQPQPKCGFVFVGSEGTLSSYDLESVLRIQTRREQNTKEIVVNENKPPFQNPIQYIINCLEKDIPVEGPLDYNLCRIGQKIVDLAVESAREKKSLPYVE
jgi:predicted dehydrogenase